MKKRRQSLFCRLMVALICSIGCASSSALAQQKMDQAAVEQWRADLRYLAEELPRRHKNLFASMTREQFEQAVGTSTWIPMLGGGDTYFTIEGKPFPDPNRKVTAFNPMVSHDFLRAR